MASGFPGSIDSFTNPLTTSALNSPSHAGQHQDLNDAVNKIETFMGLVKVIPTGIGSVGGTTATVSATGTVTVGNGNTSVTVTAFSNLYENYRIIFTGGTASATLTIRLSLAGITTGYYGGYSGASYTASTFYGQNDNNGPHWTWVGFGSSGSTLLDCDITNPFSVGTRKYINARNVYIAAGNAYGTYVGETTGTSSAASFTISTSTGSLTGGFIRVYGYRN